MKEDIKITLDGYIVVNGYYTGHRFSGKKPTIVAMIVIIDGKEKLVPVIGQRNES